jgi:hypothetical protein
MDAQQRELDNAALLEHMAGWALGVRDRTKRWLWCVAFVMIALVLTVRARLASPGLR